MRGRSVAAKREKEQLQKRLTRADMSADDAGRREEEKRKKWEED